MKNLLVELLNFLEEISFEVILYFVQFITAFILIAYYLDMVNVQPSLYQQPQAFWLPFWAYAFIMALFLGLIHVFEDKEKSTIKDIFALSIKLGLLAAAFFYVGNDDFIYGTFSLSFWGALAALGILGLTTILQWGYKKVRP